MSEERKRSVAPWIAGVLAVLGLYAGAYYGMVRQDKYSKTPYYLKTEHVEDVEEWKRTNRRYTRLFAPAHWLDRRLRSAKWNAPPRMPPDP